MTDIETVTNITEKAQQSGWSELDDRENSPLNKQDYYCIIFSHAFSRAYWGEHIAEYSIRYKDDKDNKIKKITMRLPAWKGHLLMLAHEEKPLEYFKRYMK